MKADKKKILYVDDDADDRELLTDAISHADPNIDVVLTVNGVEALTYLYTLKSKGDNYPGVIILDLNMPYMDGKTTFEKLRSDKDMQGIPVVVLSSSEKKADKTLFTDMGVVFHTKPTTLSGLGQIVDQVIGVCRNNSTAEA
ncbi:response regulator [Flavisolibacter sp. BT320]|nr:response regulator [Flavisolibacter longurius]